MRYYLLKISVFIFLILPAHVSSADITLNQLLFGLVFAELGFLLQ